MPESRVIGVSYFIQSRPAPSQPWQHPSGVRAAWAVKATALERLAERRRQQPNWEHRLMQHRTTEAPADEATG
ncbi:hypothetical protein [Streptomyces sp. NPDC046821]|uniref:hypothetical protein n=1 Tax=Streptomyces sp. NPDC046821 TaxID=3154702 RepID=UPI0033E3D893